MARRSGLGKGLSALIPTEVVGDRSSALREVPIGSIKPNPRQPRVNFDEETMSSLAASIKELGVLQPVLVRQIGGEAADEFELIAGERRWRAARRAGLQTIPVLVQTSDEYAESRAGPGGEPPPPGPQRPRGGRRLPAADRGVRVHPRPGGHPGREEPHRGDQHPPAAPASVRGPAPAGRGPDHPRPRPGPAGYPRPRLPGGPGQGDRRRRAHRPGHRGAGPRPLRRGTSPPPRTRVLRPRAAERRKRRVRSGAVRIGPGCRLPGILELEELLSGHLNTRVKVDLTSKRGKVVVEFATLEDLERIYKLMVGGARPPPV